MSLNSELLYPAPPTAVVFDDAVKGPPSKQSKVLMVRTRARAVARAASRGSLWLQLLFFSCADPVLTLGAAAIVWLFVLLSLLLLPLCGLGILAFHIPLALSRTFGRVFTWSFRALGFPCGNAVDAMQGSYPRCAAGLMSGSAWRSLLYVAIVRPVVHYVVWLVVKNLVLVAFTALCLPVATAVVHMVVGYARPAAAIVGIIVGPCAIALSLCAAHITTRLTGAVAVAVLVRRNSAAAGYEQIGEPLLPTSQTSQCSVKSCCAKSFACAGLAVCTVVMVAFCFAMSFVAYGVVACKTAVPVGNDFYNLDTTQPGTGITVNALESLGPISRWFGTKVNVVTGAVGSVNLIQTAAGSLALYSGRVAGAADFIVEPSSARLRGGCLRELLQDLAFCPRATVYLTVPVAPSPRTSLSVHTRGAIDAAECCSNVPLSAVTLNSTVGCVKLGDTSGAQSIFARSVLGKIKTASLRGAQLASIVLLSEWGRVVAARGDDDTLEADNITIRSRSWRPTVIGKMAPRIVGNVSSHGDIFVKTVVLGATGVRSEIHSRWGDVEVTTAAYGADRASLDVHVGWLGTAEVSTLQMFTGNFTVCSRDGNAAFPDSDPSVPISYDQNDPSCVRGSVSRRVGPSNMVLNVRAISGDAVVDSLF